MKNSFRKVGVTVAAAIAVAATGAAAARNASPPTFRPVNLTIAVKKPDGTAIAGLAFGTQDHIGSDNAVLAWSAISGTNGAATTTVSVDARATSLSIGVRGPASFPDAPGDDPRAEFRKRIATLKETMALPYILRIRIPTGANAVYAIFQAVPGTSLTGRLVESGPNAPIKNGFVWVEGFVADARANVTDGSIRMSGVPTGTPIWLAAGWGSRTVYRDVTIAGGPYTLGDWQLTSSDMTCPVAVTVPVPVGIPANQTPDGVSFVRSDGREVFSFVVRRSSLGASATNPDGLIGSKLQASDRAPRLAPGTYYAYPDRWTDTEAHTAFIRRLRAGDVPPTTVPKYVVTTGQTVAGTIDLAALQDAVVGWVRPYVESNGQSGTPPAP